MAEAPVWTLFAYFNDDDTGARDEHRKVAEWRVDDVVRWCRHRGYDTILLTRTEETEPFTVRPRPLLEHHFPDAA